MTAVEERPAAVAGRQPLRRPARPAPRGRPAPHRPRHVRRRRRGARDAARRVRAQRHRLRHDHRRSTSPRRASCPASSPCSPAPTSTATCSEAWVDFEGGDGGRPFRVPGRRRRALRRRAGRARRRRVALHRRGRLRPGRARHRADRRRRRPRRRARRRRPPGPPRSATSNVARRDPGGARPRARRHLRRRPPTSSPRRSTSTATCACRWSAAASCRSGTASATSSSCTRRRRAPTASAASSSRALGLPENRVRVVMGDVGGGFGQKMFMIPDELAVVLAGKRLGRPVKWIEDRRENLMAGQHARDDRMTMSVALDADGHILGVRAPSSSRTSARSRPPAAAPSASSGSCCTGPYKIPRIGFSAQGVYTNTCGRCSYRGPWMMETAAREQMMDIVARRLGIDPLELRRRNVVERGRPAVHDGGRAWSTTTSRSPRRSSRPSR